MGDIIKLKNEIGSDDDQDVHPGDMITIKYRKDRFGIALTSLSSLAPGRTHKRPIKVILKPFKQV